MKKQILISLFTLFSISSYAQLRVDSLGTTHTDSLLSTYLKVNENSSKTEGMYVGGKATFRNTNGGASQGIYGIDGSVQTYSYLAFGMNMEARQVSSISTCIGVRGMAYDGKFTVGVVGSINGSSSTTTNGAGIVGNTGASWYVPTGIYAGYFSGNVKATGTIYGTLVSPSSVSSPSNGSGETTVLSTVGERSSNVINKLQQVDLLQMERINQDGSLPANKAVEDVDENEAPIQTKLSAVSYGLAADQLQKVYPELVYEDAEGNYSINYIEMVPLLVQSIKELSAKVTSLEQQLGIAEKAEVKAESEETDDIALVVPEGAKDATLSFFDLSGKQVRTARVTAASSNAKTYTRGLPSGAYVCTLVVDGQVKSSRKIVVTNI